MRRAVLVPKEGLTVPNPANGRPLAAEGEEVVIDRYWLRRIHFEEVTELPAAGAKKSAKGKG